MKKWVILIAILISSAIILPQAVDAHRIIIEEVDRLSEEELESIVDKENKEGIMIRVRYDDGSVSTTATIIAYDVEGDELFQDKVNEAGYYQLPNNLKIFRVVAEDGMGHRAVWVQGEDVGGGFLAIPLWIRTLIGLSILGFIAAIVYYRN